jgi:predicted aspartyl protease
MTEHETPFVTGGDLIIVKAFITGSFGTTGGRFVLDTGAVLTTMTHELADSIGYVARDGIRRARVRTVIGSEEGYVLRVARVRHARVHDAELLDQCVRPRLR